jgi:hypothetical protein
MVLDAEGNPSLIDFLEVMGFQLCPIITGGK